ncbi:hypothetical protein [Aquipuribacter sp. SD81]|uniref:hypothetical protein n=1 Tax=Aquipuribacter sp. SD81 TaxID=3127703 RepID=UPI003017051C
MSRFGASTGAPAPVDVAAAAGAVRRRQMADTTPVRRRLVLLADRWPGERL